VFSTRSPTGPTRSACTGAGRVGEAGAVGVDALEAVDGTPVLDLETGARRRAER
jgi:tRNA (Thr-GGU) A37 N-methylase